LDNAVLAIYKEDGVELRYDRNILKTDVRPHFSPCLFTIQIWTTSPVILSTIKTSNENITKYAHNNNQPLTSSCLYRFDVMGSSDESFNWKVSEDCVADIFIIEKFA
jgi:hypothetical protein